MRPISVSIWILIYQFDERKGLLKLNDPPSAHVAPGAGPRHFSVHPSGRFGYVINEMNCTVTAFTRDMNTGALQELQTVSALPPKMAVQPGFSGAELEVPSVGPVSLHVDSRPQQHCALHDRSEHRPFDVRREHADPRQHAAWVRRRSGRQIPAGRESGVGFGRRISHRRADGQAHRHGEQDRRRRTGLHQIREVNAVRGSRFAKLRRTRRSLGGGGRGSRQNAYRTAPSPGPVSCPVAIMPS